MLKRFRSVVFAGMAMIIAACATAPGDQAGFRRLAEADALIVFDADVFRDVTPARVTHVNFFQRQEYARFEKDGARAEAILVRTRNGPGYEFSVDFSMTTPDVIEQWAAFKGKTVEQGEPEHLDPGWTRIWARPFAVPADDLSCMAFTAEWDRHLFDPRSNPDQVLFGYHCAPPGQALDVAARDALIAGIGVRGVNRPFRGDDPYVSTPPDEGLQSSLAELARNAAPAFPFEMVRGYAREDNCPPNDPC